jgi:hypothetical protein
MCLNTSIAIIATAPPSSDIIICGVVNAIPIIFGLCGDNPNFSMYINFVAEKLKNKTFTKVPSNTPMYKPILPFFITIPKPAAKAIFPITINGANCINGAAKASKGIADIGISILINIL